MQQVMQNMGLEFSIQRQFDFGMVLQSVYLENMLHSGIRLDQSIIHKTTQFINISPYTLKLHSSFQDSTIK